MSLSFLAKHRTVANLVSVVLFIIILVILSMLSSFYTGDFNEQHGTYIPEFLKQDGGYMAVSALRLNDSASAANTSSKQPIEARYIVLSNHMKEMRLGNNIWRLVSPYGMALQFGWKFLLHDWKSEENLQPLLDLFDLDVSRNEALKQGVIIFNSTLMTSLNVASQPLIAESQTCAFERRIYDHMNKPAGSRSVLRVETYLQSHRYFLNHDADVRKLLSFRPEVRAYAQRYLHSVLVKIAAGNQSGQTSKVCFVAVHIRRGDFIKFHDYGFAVASITYIYNAMSYFVHEASSNSKSHLAFVVTSEDLQWFKSQFNLSALHSHYLSRYSGNTLNIIAAAEQSLPVTLSVHFPTENRESGFAISNPSYLDFAILANCNHTIMTVGSFGFWAAFLANGTTVYFDKPYRAGSEHARNFNMADSFFSHWIPMSAD